MQWIRDETCSPDSASAAGSLLPPVPAWQEHVLPCVPHAYRWVEEVAGRMGDRGPSGLGSTQPEKESRAVWAAAGIACGHLPSCMWREGHSVEGAHLGTGVPLSGDGSEKE